MSTRTPEQITSFLDATMYALDMPQQYYGDEPNSYGKDWDSVDVRMCIFASWPYEQAAGNQSIPLVYKTVNEAGPWVLCDRSYLAATPRDWNKFDKHGIPVFGVEQRHQLRDYDVIGTSISYPVLCINFAQQLKRSDIPLRFKDRHQSPESWPMVIVGGQSYGAPEGISPMVDAYWMGEVEDEPGNPGIAAVMDRVRAFKAAHLWDMDRMECYRRLALEFDFLYFPCFIDIHYDYEYRQEVADVAYTWTDLRRETVPSKQVVGHSSNLPGMVLPRRKRIVKDMDSVVGLDNPPLLYIDPGMGSGDLEVGRGCPAWCSFCALTYRQKPYRQRSPEYMVDFGQRLLRNTGGVHVAPFSPDFPMHTQKKQLIRALMENVTDEVDASSMRVDDFIADSEYILLQAHAGMDQVTLGVEGNSQRMRDLVGKGCADEDIKEAVARGIRAGIRRFKLYMICDLPGEDDGDIYRILKLARELADIRDGMGQHTVKIQFSWTPLLVEANTPFQWFAPTVSNRALGDVWHELKNIKIDFKLGAKAEKNKQTFFQLTQRSSRDSGEAIVDVLESLPSACWGGVPGDMAERLEKALKAHGFNNGFADLFDERHKKDMFGWEWLDQGINVELLWVTYQQMREFLENTDSHTYDGEFTDDYHGNEWIERCDTKCYGKTCGTCDVDDLRIRQNYIRAAQSETSIDLMNVKVIDQKSVAMKLRLKVRMFPEKRFVANDHWRYAVRRAAYRVGLPITKRTVRFADDSLKMKNFTSGVNYVEFGVTKRINSKELEALIPALNGELTGMEVLQISPYPGNADPLRSDIDLTLYEVEVDEDLRTLDRRLEDWANADYVKLVLKEEARRGGLIREEVNAKDHIPDIWAVRDGHRLKLRMMIRGRVSPYDAVMVLLHKSSPIEAQRYPAIRLDCFIEQDDRQDDFFYPTCVETGTRIPVNPLGQPYDLDYSPKAKDRVAGLVVADVQGVPHP